MRTLAGDPLWSILVATVAWREEKFLELMGSLLPQCEASPAGIEVVALQNAGQLSLARYRQRLLDSACGRYVCFVDDDDMVAPNYVEEIVSALVRGPDVVGFLQECSGLPVRLTVLSLDVRDGQTMEPVPSLYGPAYERAFSHMCPVRTELALKGSFLGLGEVYTGEDAAFVRSVLPLLRERGSRQEFIPKPLYHYRWSSADTTQSLLGPPPTGILARAARHQLPRVTSPCFRWIT